MILDTEVLRGQPMKRSANGHHMRWLGEAGPRWLSILRSSGYKNQQMIPAFLANARAVSPAVYLCDSQEAYATCASNPDFSSALPRSHCAIAPRYISTPDQRPQPPTLPSTYRNTPTSVEAYAEAIITCKYSPRPSSQLRSFCAKHEDCVSNPTPHPPNSTLGTFPHQPNSPIAKSSFAGGHVCERSSRAVPIQTSNMAVRKAPCLNPQTTWLPPTTRPCYKRTRATGLPYVGVQSLW
jgi:hypothetical protein